MKLPSFDAHSKSLPCIYTTRHVHKVRCLCVLLRAQCVAQFVVDYLHRGVFFVQMIRCLGCFHNIRNLVVASFTSHQSLRSLICTMCQRLQSITFEILYSSCICETNAGERKMKMNLGIPVQEVSSATAFCSLILKMISKSSDIVN